MNPLLEWEINWIRNNSKRYDSPLHLESVCSNIVKRYRIKELEKQLEELKDEINKERTKSSTWS